MENSSKPSITNKQMTQNQIYPPTKHVKTFRLFNCEWKLHCTFNIYCENGKQRMKIYY